MKTIIGTAIFVAFFSSAAIAAPEPDVINANAATPLPQMAPQLAVKSESATAQEPVQMAAASTKKGRCVRRAFEVNDFGKEGPISLAKKDLANYVAKIKKREGVRNVRVSQKKPVCRLYLWLGPASEYTCRVEASICW